jgi:hypothetical protein
MLFLQHCVHSQFSTVNFLLIRRFDGFFDQFRLPDEAHFVKFPHLGGSNGSDLKHPGRILVYFEERPV